MKNETFLKLLKKIIKILGNISFFFVKHVFFTCFLILILVLIIGSGLFYKYVFRVMNKKIKISDFESLSLEKNAYNNILKTWEEENKRCASVGENSYFDPFYSYAPSIKSPSPSSTPSPSPTPTPTPTPSPSPSPSSTPTPESAKKSESTPASTPESQENSSSESSSNE